MNTIQVGLGITRAEQLVGAPLGTVLTWQSEEYVRCIDGWHHGRDIYGANNLQFGQITKVGTVPIVETLATYQQRLATVARGSAHVSSVSLEPVREGLSALGTGEVDPNLGAYVHVRDFDLLDNLEPDTYAMVGHPSDWDRFGLYRWNGSDFGHRAGPRSRLNTRWTLRIVDPLHPLPPEPDESEQIRAYAAKVWDLGLNLKSQQGWCGTFELTMGQLDIGPWCSDWTRVTDPPATPCSVGDMVSATVMRDMPLGAVFRYRGSDTAWTMYVRHPESTNPGGTLLLCHNELGGDYASHGNEVLYTGVGEMRIPVTSYDEMHRMPVGTWVAESVSEWTAVKQEDGSWRGNGANLRADQWNIDHAYYTGIPYIAQED